MSDLHIPILRSGVEYQSVDLRPILDHRDGSIVGQVSYANAGLISRDLARGDADWEALQHITTDEAIAFCKAAAPIFMNDILPVGEATQSPDDFTRMQSATTAMPVNMCRANMGKIARALENADRVLDSLTGGISHDILDAGYGQHDGRTTSYQAARRRLSAILPNNSPGVHALWVPALAMRMPLTLKPGNQEPWTPWRIIQALLKAGYPKEAFSYYPADHGPANTILMKSEAVLIFGDEKTVKKWEHDPRVEVHGPGWSKVILDQEASENWEPHIDTIVESIAANGGRSCVNASSVWVTHHADEISQAIAAKLAERTPLSLVSNEATLAGFSNPAVADWVDTTLVNHLETEGAEDVSAPLRSNGRVVAIDGTTFIQPTIVRIDDEAHELAELEFLFPYASIRTIPESDMFSRMKQTLVCSVISDNPDFRKQALRCRNINRLNFGDVPTGHVDWDQPHEGNLFDLMFERRSFQQQSTTEEATGPEIISGPGTLSRLPEIVKSLACARPLLISDCGISEAGIVARAETIFREAGMVHHTWLGVMENPTTITVEAGLAFAQHIDFDCIVGIGGGSSMDCAKGINFLYTNGGRMQDYWGKGKAHSPMLPAIAVPTTAGTGSETQSFALITDPLTHRKMACGDKKAMFKACVLDPELTLSQPRSVAVVTAIDAISHAVESAVTNVATDRSREESLKAWELLIHNLPLMLSQPDNLKAREALQQGAMHAGAAIEESMLGAAHACANPLTGNFGIVHGNAVALTLPHVVRFNSEVASDMYLELCKLANLDTDKAHAGETLAAHLTDLISSSGLPTTLAAFDIPEDRIPELAAGAAEQWTGGFNPRPLSVDDYIALYSAAYDGGAS